MPTRHSQHRHLSRHDQGAGSDRLQSVIGTGPGHLRPLGKISRVSGENAGSAVHRRRPAISYVAAQKLNYDVDEFAVAGGLVKAPIRVVKAKTVPLMVPADAEIIIEGWVNTEWLEPEAPW